MGKYRKKPVVIDAFKLGVDNMPDWFMDSVTANKVVLHGTSSGFYHADDTNADIYTLEGWHHANYGDYIIRGVKGELYPCKPDIFDMTYDMVYQPKTNADRIRAMTDEELARQFAQYEYSVAKEVLAHFGIDIATMDYDAEVAAKDLLEQLQQPAEGDVK